MTKGKRRSQQEWESIFQHQKDSDLNVQAYCEQHNMCSKTFSPFIKIKKTSGVTLLVNNASVLHYQNCKIHLHANADANWDAQIMKALS